jgi:hypothetical protein
MLRRRIVAGSSRALRVMLALSAVSACLGAVAYAAIHPQSRESVSGADGRRGGKKASGGKASGGPQRQTRPTQPRFIEVPTAPSIGAQAQFRFHVVPRMQRPRRRPPPNLEPGGEAPRLFQCRLDGSGWEACESPHRMTGLEPGGHSFAVRALSPAGRPGPAGHFAWEQLEPKPFSVETRAGELEELNPGDPAQELPLLVTNPNPVPIVLTRLTVAVGSAPDGCPADPNFALTPSSVSPAAPLTVPAGASVSLPSAAATAPAIALRDLPFNQNACQGARVPLVVSGEAHG